MLASEPHVSGLLAGERGARPEPLWLIAQDGSKLSLIWPEGFAVRFDPEAALYDENGQLKARAGDRIELNQSAGEHAGTYEDPYIAAWFIGDPGCHLYRP